VTVPVSTSNHSVELDYVPSNCTVSGNNPRTVTASGGITEVPFAVSCLDTGSVHLTIATTGTDIDQTGYVVCVSSPVSSCLWSAFVLANDVITISSVTAGPHTVSLTNVAGNCTVSGGAARAATVPAHGTVSVAFDVACVLAERIAFSNSGTITIMRVDGLAAQAITHGFAPAWSHDGTRLAYECDLDICTINADGTGFAQLTMDGASNHHPTWSPDGSKIAFAATHGGVPDLWVMAANGSGAVQLTHSVGFQGSPSWSPDGTRIAFDCQVDPGNDDICVVNADGTGLVRLTSDPAHDYGAAWKPDGSTLAFATTRYGGNEIVLMSPAGGSVSRIGSGLSGIEPGWSPDGTQLTFVQVDQFGTRRITVAHTDGSNIVVLAVGDQPSWKPHP
jgi:WD40-like Beta Propeller Repeat